MIGDPCYTLPTGGSRRTEHLADWQAFCRLLGRDEDVSEPAGEGAGIVIRVPGGDGTYPVLGRRDPLGALTAVQIVFEAKDVEYD